MKSKVINININSKEYIDEFYKHLRWYIIFKKKYIMKLNISDNINDSFKNELKEIERIFNIKDRHKRINAMYLSVCDYIDKYYIDKNVCEFKNDTCVCQRMGFEKAKINGCCGSCKYLEEHGCSIKSLACKLFYCRYMKKKNKIFKPNDIKVFKYFYSPAQKVIAKFNFFHTEEENCKLLYKNSILAFAFTKDAKVDRFKEVD